jgi:hypothetical protein
LTESFGEYLGELIPRIFLRKYNLHFLFLKSFDLLFFTVFCAKQIPGSPFSQKKNGKYLGDSIIHQIVGITIFSKKTLENRYPTHF